MLRHYPHRPNDCLELCNSGYIITNVYETKTKRFIHGSQRLVSPKHQHQFSNLGLNVYQKQHKLIFHQVLRGNMLLIAVKVFRSYSSRNLTVTLCNGLIGHGCLNQLFMMLICL